jgi:hypothetical protein
VSHGIRWSQLGALALVALAVCECGCMYEAGPRRHPRRVVVGPPPPPVVVMPAPPPPPDQVIIVAQPPPPPRVEVVTVRPSRAHVWVPGYWTWRSNAHVWVPGVWAVPPRGGAVWAPPQWRQVPGGWHHAPGHWR